MLKQAQMQKMTNNKIIMRIFLAINLVVLSFSNTLAATPNQSTAKLSPQINKISKNYFVLSLQQWSIPKNMQSILNMPALRLVMLKLMEHKQQCLVIRYPGGEVGILWASELKAWLVSSGVSSERIELQTGSLKSDELHLFVNNLVLH